MLPLTPFALQCFLVTLPTQFRLLCINTNLVMLQNTEKLGDVQTNTKRGVKHRVGILGNFGCISVNLHRRRNLQ